MNSNPENPNRHEDLSALYDKLKKQVTKDELASFLTEEEGIPLEAVIEEMKDMVRQKHAEGDAA